MDNKWTATHYIVYDELTILMLTDLNEVCEFLVEGGCLYGYASSEDAARTMMAECFSKPLF